MIDRYPAALSGISEFSEPVERGLACIEPTNGTQGPPTHNEIWDATIDILQHAPAAYVQTENHYTPTGTHMMLRSLWLFSDYRPDTNQYDYYAVDGRVEASRLPDDVLRALEHIGTNNRRLSDRQKQAGVLGWSALSLFTKAVAFPEESLLRTVLDTLPDKLNQLSVQARCGVEGQQWHSHPVDFVTCPVSNPHFNDSFGRRLTAEEKAAAFAELHAVNGDLEQLAPNFGWSRIETERQQPKRRWPKFRLPSPA